MTTQRFKAIVAKTGARTFIVIPFNPNAVWGIKQRHHITGSVNGYAKRPETRAARIAEMMRLLKAGQKQK